MDNSSADAPLYQARASLYDLIYDGLDYPALAAELHQRLADEGVPDGARLLEVACGTGLYLEPLRTWYAVQGLDINAPMLAIAAERLPGVELTHGDMAAFSLPQPVDVVACLFSSIAYLHGPERLTEAAQCFARALRPGGVCVVEPFVSPTGFYDGRPNLDTYDSPDLKLARAAVPRREGTRAVIDFNWLVVPRGGPIEHFTDHHELELFDAEQSLAIFRQAGFDVRYDKEGLTKGRGLIVATRR